MKDLLNVFIKDYSTPVLVSQEVAKELVSDLDGEDGFVTITDNKDFTVRFNKANVMLIATTKETTMEGHKIYFQQHELSINTFFLNGILDNEDEHVVLNDNTTGDLLFYVNRLHITAIL